MKFAVSKSFWAEYHWIHLLFT